ncbi:hypothetical protein BCR36DRAFT_414325 [Piromyces finnis]|uniref:FCH-domain-containing protein n=1 Tax=Piromyces finnis TaxID=1754191 RepID=A0A1Y1V3V8_9FUNG|nr:hypothetical protein BCR36DRAFT_414325 [Piromyces finnis]|eukprot:ORX46018.1 hypothetical protein BCR36DRAFT_414325 [Piromyces finnis]
MTYGESFQDKTVIENYLISSINFLTDFREYLKERVQLEKNYAKESANLIQKYSQKFEKKGRQSICISSNGPNVSLLSPSSVDNSTLNVIPENGDSVPTSPSSPTSDINSKDSYTYVNAWRSILNQMKIINDSRNKFSEKLTNLVIDKLKTLISIREDERKNNIQNLKNINNELDKLVIEKNNARKKYIESCDLMVNHHKKLTKQDSSLNDNDKSNDKGVKKIEKLIDATQVDMDNRKNLYILTLQSMNALKKKIVNEYVPEIFNNLQNCQETTIGAFQHHCQNYVKLEQDLYEEIKNSFSNALIDINAIDPISDNVLFEKENKKEWVPAEEEKFSDALNNNTDVNFSLTSKASIYLSTLKDNMENQMIADQEKYNSIKVQYNQLVTAYQSYVNNPASIDCKEMIDNQIKLWNDAHLTECSIIINEAKIEAITNAIGEDLQVNSHNFKSVMFINATVCDYCQEKIRGKALQCKSCSFVCHSKCENDVPQRCTGIKMDRKALRINKISDASNHGRALSINSSINSAVSMDNCSTPLSAATNPSPLATASSETNSPINYDEINENEYSVNNSQTNISNNEEDYENSNEKDDATPTSVVMCAIFEYQPQNNDEISLSLNDRVEIIEKEVDGWVKVRTDHGEGFVPSTYIASVKKAIYDFNPDKEDEIPLHEGESVVVLGQEDDGWLKIKKGTMEGIVPESYIDM